MTITILTMMMIMNSNEDGGDGIDGGDEINESDRDESEIDDDDDDDDICLTFVLCSMRFRQGTGRRNANSSTLNDEKTVFGVFGSPFTDSHRFGRCS